MDLKVAGTLKASSNIQCPSSMVRGEVLRQFDALSNEVEIASSETLSFIFKFGYVILPY